MGAGDSTMDDASESGSFFARRSRKRGNREYPYVSLGDFRYPEGFMNNIGEGGFGKVTAMVKTDSGNRFAIKTLNKAKLIAKNQVKNAFNELDILKSLEHSKFVVNLFYAFQDEDTLYMCSNLMLGGSLQHALANQFKEHKTPFELERIRLWSAELVLGIHFLHVNRVVHRDIKPDNILLDHLGHLRITDFNVSIRISEEEELDAFHRDGWGTRGYRAPEVYLRKGNGLVFACDWWSMGVVIYNMLTGKIPFNKKKAEEPNSTLVGRMKREKFDESRLENEDAKHLIRELLRFEPDQRLGCSGGPNSEVIIMTHKFFHNIDWDELDKPIPHAQVTDSRKEQGLESCDHVGNSSQQSENLKQYASNFDPSLDQKEKIRVLQRNMGIIGFEGFDSVVDDDDADFVLRLTREQQVLFKNWAFNVDFTLEQKSRPQYTLLQTVSSMPPQEMRTWITKASVESLRALCKEIKQYREQAMQENYDNVMAQVKNDNLIQQNLQLMQEVVKYKREITQLRKRIQELEYPEQINPEKTAQPVEDHENNTTTDLSTPHKPSKLSNVQSPVSEDEIVLFQPSTSP